MPVAVPKNVVAEKPLARQDFPHKVDLQRPLYLPHGKWAPYATSIIRSNDQGILLNRKFLTEVRIKTGTLPDGQKITYITKLFSPSAIPPIGLFGELYLYSNSSLLRPLQGDVVPFIMSLNNAPGGRLAFNMEPPHSNSWRESDRYMSEAEKRRVVEAYQKIHERGIMHGAVHPQHVLIGKDGKVQIIQFQNAKLRHVPNIPGGLVPLQECTDDDIALEMRKVHFMLDFGDARQLEYRRAIAKSMRKASSARRAKLMMLAKSKDAEQAVDDTALVISVRDLEDLEEASAVLGRKFELDQGQVSVPPAQVTQVLRDIDVMMPKKKLKKLATRRLKRKLENCDHAEHVSLAKVRVMSKVNPNIPNGDVPTIGRGTSPSKCSTSLEVGDPNPVKSNVMLQSREALNASSRRNGELKISRPRPEASVPESLDFTWPKSSPRLSSPSQWSVESLCGNDEDPSVHAEGRPKERDQSFASTNLPAFADDTGGPSSSSTPRDATALSPETPALPSNGFATTSEGFGLPSRSSQRSSRPAVNAESTPSVKSKRAPSIETGDDPFDGIAHVAARTSRDDDESQSAQPRLPKLEHSPAGAGISTSNQVNPRRLPFPQGTWRPRALPRSTSTSLPSSSSKESGPSHLLAWLNAQSMRNNQSSASPAESPETIPPSWQGYAARAVSEYGSSSAPILPSLPMEEPMRDRLPHIRATRPLFKSQNVGPYLVAELSDIPSDLEPYFGHWMGKIGCQDIARGNLGTAYVLWLQALAREVISDSVASGSVMKAVIEVQAGRMDERAERDRGRRFDSAMSLIRQSTGPLQSSQDKESDDEGSEVRLPAELQTRLLAVLNEYEGEKAKKGDTSLPTQSTPAPVTARFSSLKRKRTLEPVEEASGLEDVKHSEGTATTKKSRCA